MTMRRAFLISIFVFLFLAASARSLLATSFTVVVGGFSTLPPDDIFAPGPVSTYPGIGTIEVNAFSFGYVGLTVQDVLALQFSVDPPSVGAAGTAVAAQAAIAEAEADIFASAGGGGNIQIFDGDGIPGPTPGLGLVEPGDDVDGYDTRPLPAQGLIWWSADPPSAASFFPPFSPADIVVDTIPLPFPYTLTIVPKTLFAPAASIGLVPTDDINALIILEDGLTVGGPISSGDCVLFSLVPGSPSLATIGTTGAGPEDVIASGPGCPDPTGFVIPWVFAAGATLGLLPGDNIDALDIYEDPTAIDLLAAEAHSPSSATVSWLVVVPLGIMSAAVFWRRRRQQQVNI